MDMLLQTVEREGSRIEDCLFLDSEFDIFDEEMFEDFQLAGDDWETEF